MTKWTLRFHGRKRTHSLSPPTVFRDRGFTLIELLIGVALTAILLTAIYGTLFTILRGGEGIEGETDNYLAVGRFTDRFSREIRAASFAAGNPLTLFRGALKGTASEISFTTIAYPAVREEIPTSDITVVRYFLESGDEGDSIVMETWDPYRGEPLRAVVLDEVNGFDVAYYNGTDWTLAWDGKLEKRLPDAVKVTVILPDGEHISSIARTMIR
ncbi:MAG: type II secretion system protein GspJ [Thermodesulfobacteriota bacterium]